MLMAKVCAGMRKLLLLPSVALFGCSIFTGSDGPDISLHALLGHVVAEPPVLRVDIGGQRKAPEGNALLAKSQR